jgi:hypothetical protein
MKQTGESKVDSLNLNKNFNLTGKQIDTKNAEVKASFE